MPPSRSTSLGDRSHMEALDDLAITLGEYFWLITKHTDGARFLPNFPQIYEQGCAEWARIAPIVPSSKDEAFAEKKQAYLDACDRYCKCDTPSDPVQSIVAVQAAGYAMQVLSLSEVEILPESDRCYVRRKIGEYTSEKIRRSRVVQAGIPTHTPNTLIAPIAQRMIPHKPGTVVKYSTEDGRKAECTIVDYGTSQVRGDWFEVQHGQDGPEERLTKEQMFDILDHSMDIHEPGD